MSLYANAWLALRRAGWAPLAVIVLHQICTKAGWRSQTDWLLHFLGGAAITFFLFHAIAAFRGSLGSPSRIGHLIHTFCAASTVALAWDLTEFASDELLGSDIQHSLKETMLDLSFGVGGALLMCIALGIVSQKTRW